MMPKGKGVGVEPDADGSICSGTGSWTPSILRRRTFSLRRRSHSACTAFTRSSSSWWSLIELLIRINSRNRCCYRSRWDITWSLGWAVQCKRRGTWKVLRIVKYLFRALTRAMCPRSWREASSAAFISSVSSRRFPKAPRPRIELFKSKSYCTHTLGSTRATNFARTVRSLRFQPVHKILRVKANRTCNSKRRYHSFCRHFVKCAG
jgi:hypothetical protein